MTKNYYDILGVEETATYSEIAEAYNHLSESYNPANFENNPVFLNIYEEIQEAYNILGNLSSRREYDVQLKKSSMVNYPEDKIEDELEINSSGWFTLLLFVPIISIFTLLYLFLASGTMGANKYGLPPD